MSPDDALIAVRMQRRVFYVQFVDVPYLLPSSGNT